VLELGVPRGRGTVGKPHGNLAEQPSTICSAGQILESQITPQGSLNRIPEPLTDYGKGSTAQQQISPLGPVPLRTTFGPVPPRNVH